jgi:hypothetical protein
MCIDDMTATNYCLGTFKRQSLVVNLGVLYLHDSFSFSIMPSAIGHLISYSRNLVVHMQSEIETDHCRHEFPETSTEEYQRVFSQKERTIPELAAASAIPPPPSHAP